jgi:hypothetical protein
MNRRIRRIFAAICTLLALSSLLGGCTFSLSAKDVADAEETSSGKNPVGTLSFATEGVSVVHDSESLNEKVDAMMEAAQQPGIGVEYQNEAHSTDGQNFQCYIGNPSGAEYPVFIAIYADATYQEELFVSGLINPGFAFTNVELSRPLTEPETRLYVCYTQCVEEDGEWKIRGQTIVTIQFFIDA